MLEILEPVIDLSRPDASFYLWLKTPIDDAEFARGLFAQQNVTVLPGSYLSRPGVSVTKFSWRRGPETEKFLVSWRQRSNSLNTM